MTTSTDNPNNFLPGTWEKVEGRFLLGSGSIIDYDRDMNETTYTYTAGNTGGETMHQLTGSEMPQHTHSITWYKNKGTTSTGNIKAINAVQQWWDEITGQSIASNTSGYDKAHNNMPPYLVVNIWKRIA